MSNSNSSSNTVTSIAANNYINTGSSASNTTSIPINPLYYSYSSSGTSDECNSAKALCKSNNIELHLLNGLKILLKLEWNNIYNLKELHKRTFKFTKKFPFLHISSFPYTTFKYRTHYSYMNSSLDPKYNVDCPLTAFMNLIGINYEKFEDAVVEDAIKNGS